MSFSVLMSVYKKENPNYLKESLESVFQQTMLPEEVILMEDGPLTEELYQIIEIFQKQYPQLHTHALPQNVQLGRALAQGVCLCNNELVARMDTDDVAVPNRFEIQFQYMLTHPKITVTGGLMEEFSDDGSTHQRKEMPELQKDILTYAKLRNPLNHMTVMFRKSEVLKVGNYRHFPYLEDYDLWSRLLAQQAQFYNLQQVLVRTRVSPQVYSRRGGFSYCKNYLRLRKQQRESGLLNLGEYLKACIVTIGITVISGEFREKIYKKYLRKRI